MIIAIDFDGTIVEQDRPYGDLEAELKFIEGAKEALESLKRAGHTLILWSGRANLANREDWHWNPGYAQGTIPFDLKQWVKAKGLHQELYEEMLLFVAKELSGIFAYVDDGKQGKPSADLFLDNLAVTFSGDWDEIAFQYGDQR